MIGNLELNNPHFHNWRFRYGLSLEEIEAHYRKICYGECDQSEDDDGVSVASHDSIDSIRSRVSLSVGFGYS